MLVEHQHTWREQLHLDDAFKVNRCNHSVNEIRQIEQRIETSGTIDHSIAAIPEVLESQLIIDLSHDRYQCLS